MNPTPSIPPANSPHPQVQEIDLLDYVSIIMRRWKVFVACLCVIFFGVALHTFLMKPVYEASALLHVKDDKGKVGLLNELTLNTTNPVNAEIEILKSRSNAEQVVRQLHLDWKVSKKSEGMSARILEFKTDAKNPVYRVKLTGKDGFDVIDDNGELVIKGKSGVLARKKDFSILLNDIKGQPGDSFQLELLNFALVVESLQAGIKAVEQGRQTGIIRVSYSSTDPVLARDVVNMLVNAYLEQSISFKSEEASRAVGFVDEQLKSLRGDLEVSEKNLQSYKSTTGVVKLDSEAEGLIQKMAAMEKDRAEIVLQQNQVKFSMEAMKNAMRSGTVYTPAAIKLDPVMSELAAKLSELEIQRRTLQGDYTSAHPMVKNIQSQIEGVQKRILSTYETNLSNLKKQEESIAAQIAAYEGQMRNLPEAERDLARLTRVTKVNSDIYTFLLQKHEEARIAKASTIGNINIVDPAIIPIRPISPKVVMNLLLGLLVGLGAGIGLAFFQEYLDDTIKNGEEAKRALGLPLLAVIPHIAGSGTGQNGTATAIDPLIAQREPKSIAAEAFRALRTSVHFSAINRDKKIMLLTSSFPGEGKSIISANLAAIFSQTGAKVLIVDCDLRRSSLHEKFSMIKTPGLSELLTGDATFEETKQDTGIPGLDMIAAGTTPPNPAELLGSESMRGFLLTQREKYDHIIIDAPPVLAVTDAPVLTAVADIVILVMEAGRVPVKAAQHMRETLATVKASVAGLVINDKTGKGESYGYYGGNSYRYGKYRGYGYGYGYGYYSDDEKNKPRKETWVEKLTKLIPGGKGNKR